MRDYKLLVIPALFLTAVTAYHIVQETGTDGQVALATAASQKLCGVTTNLDFAAGETGDICKGGIAPVIFGGAVAAGDPLTSDGTGRAIKAVEGDYVIGVAQEKGVAGTIGSVLITPVAKLAGAGVAALVAAGLGAGVDVDHADATPKTVLAAHATKDRALLVIATCTESLAGNDAPTFKLGWDVSLEGIFAAATLAGGTAGTVKASAGVLPATKALIATLATGGTTTNDAGAYNFVVLALPTT
jgi:hypothetical protein